MVSGFDHRPPIMFADQYRERHRMDSANRWSQDNAIAIF
jgi:hypothetical protein